MNKTILTSLLFILLFSSCTVEKMRYSKGYHIEWLGKKNHTVVAKKAKEKKEKYTAKTTQNKSVIIEEKSLAIKPEIQTENIEITQISKEKNTKNQDNIASLKPLNKAEKKIEIRKNNVENITQKHVVYKSNKTQLVGIALFLISILFAALGYALYIGLGVFFGTLFLVIFLIAAGIFLISAIVSIFV